MGSRADIGLSLFPCPPPFNASEPTRIMVPPLSLDANVGQSLVLPCEVSCDSSLDPNFKWFFNGKAIDFSRQEHFEMIGTVRVTWPNADYGDCSAEGLTRVSYWSFVKSVNLTSMTDWYHTQACKPFFLKKIVNTNILHSSSEPQGVTSAFMMSCTQSMPASHWPTHH